MRFLVLEPFPNFGGGSEGLTLSLARELGKLGHVLYLAHDRDGSMLTAYGQVVQDVVRTNLPGFSRRSPIKTAAGLLNLGRILKSRQIDAAITSHLGFFEFGAIARHFFGVPFCFHLGLTCPGSSPTLRLAYKGAGAGITPSQHTYASWLAAGWPTKSLHVVPNWADPAVFCPHPDPAALRRELGLPERARCVVFVGRVCAEKGVSHLVQAFAMMAPSLQDAILVIVGVATPEYQRELQALIGSLDRGLRDRIVLRPATANPEKFLSTADLVCAPSAVDESFGMTVVEAMSCGVPVIATRVGIMGEILGANAAHLIVSPGDVGALAQRIAWWLERPEARAACGAQLRERAVQAYGPGASVRAYERILAGLAARGRHPRP